MVALTDDLAAAQEMASEDESMAAEVPVLEAGLVDATESLRSLLIPRDPNDGRDVIMEIKGGEGGRRKCIVRGGFVTDVFVLRRIPRLENRSFGQNRKRYGWFQKTSRSRSKPTRRTPQRVCGRV